MNCWKPRWLPYSAVILLSACGSDDSFTNSHASRVNDTGITTCADYAYGSSANHSISVNCFLATDTEGDPVPPGQDAVSGRDSAHNDNRDGYAGFSFTKIGAKGESLPANATEWFCVKDNVTGLIWEIKQGKPNDIVGDSGLHDPDDRYVWYEPDATRNGGFAGYEKHSDGHSSWSSDRMCHGYGSSGSPSANCNTKTYVDQVNAEKLCGANDWRMPTVNELLSIADFSHYALGLDSGYVPLETRYFPNERPLSAYWSNTPVVDDPERAWHVFYGSSGGDGYDWRYGDYQVRLVRSVEPKPNASMDSVASHCTNLAIPANTPLSDFTFNNDGTVLHKATNLVWKRCQEGQVFSDNGTSGNYLDDHCNEAPSSMNWRTALEHVQSVNNSNGFAGKRNWRVPNLKELNSIVEYCRSAPAINPFVFPASSEEMVWSSSPVVDTPYYPSYSAGVHFNLGGDTHAARDNALPVRLVRFR